MTDEDWDDLALLTIIPALAESPWHSLEQAAEGFDLYVNANKKKCVLNKNEPFKWQTSEIRKPVRIIQQQYLIYRM